LPPVGILAGRQFLSTGVTIDGAPFALVAGTRIRLTIDDGRLSANAGCNIVGGTLTIDGNKLLFSGASMTEMACDPARMSQDDWFVALLGAGPTFVLNGNDLTLTSGTTVVTLLDREIAEPDQPLVGPTWSLAALINGDVVASVPVGGNARITFAADGTFALNDGCNSGFGDYAVDGDAIAFANIATTKIACSGAAAQIELAVLTVLRSASISFAIDANSLTLMAGAAGLQFSAIQL
jgi:heat shock protein HslJ